MRVYYNERLNGPGETLKLDHSAVCRRTYAAYHDLCRGDYFQKAFGYHCVDAGQVHGEVGLDLAEHFYSQTGLKVDDSVEQFLQSADDVHLFTFVEFVYDYVAKPDPNTGHHHSYMMCGMHYDHWSSEFDVPTAQQEWRNKVNGILKYYGDGFSVTEAGEVIHTSPKGFEELLAAAPPPQTSTVNKSKLANAVRTFHRGVSSRQERKQAIRDLVDLLEFHRADVKTQFLKKDEADLFAIANNFALRHHRSDQKDDYDDSWLKWLFYLYLSTVHLVLDLVHRQSSSDTEEQIAKDDEFPF